MKKATKNKKSGFTLVELVVVIAIIGVLAAVITPRVRNALVKAKDAKAVATLDGLRTAVNVYHAETGRMITGNPGTPAIPDTPAEGENPVIPGTPAVLPSGFLTMADIDVLRNAKYLDSTGGLKKDTNGDILVEAGTIATVCDASGKPTTSTPGELKILVTNGTSLSFVQYKTNVANAVFTPIGEVKDTGCKLWKDK